MIEILPFTRTEKVQLLPSPAESVTQYVILVVPTCNVCGGSRPLRFRRPRELSLVTGIFHITVAYGFPLAVETSIAAGH